MDKKQKKSESFILEHQKEAFDELIAIGHACISLLRDHLPISLRFNTMLVGPSGSGKSHLARIVAAELGIPFLPITVTSWILLGSADRAGVRTWQMILSFLNKNANAPGVMIFLDEIDKLADCNTSWDIHLKCEVFNLLDLQIPSGVKDDTDDEINDDYVSKAQKKLSNRTFIMAAGAFQHIWEARARTKVGFHSQPASSPRIDLNILAKTLPREVTNRFRSKVIILPQLTEADYHRMLQLTAPRLPTFVQQTFLLMGERRIPGALNCHQGCRFVEELLLDVFIQEHDAILDKTIERLGTEHSKISP